MLRALVFVSSILTVALSSEYDEPTARLVLFKSTKTVPVVEGKEFSVQYEVFNTGDLSAHEIQISDRYDPSSFAIIGFDNDEGSVSISKGELRPGESWNFNITVVPKLFGIYESTRARMRYVSGDVDPESEEDLEASTRNAYSSTVGRIQIISAEEHSKNQTMDAARHAFWAAVFVVPAIFAMLYFNKESSAQTGSKKERSSKKKK